LLHILLSSNKDENFTILFLLHSFYPNIIQLADELSSSALVGHLENANYMGNSHVPIHEVGGFSWLFLSILLL